MPLLKLALSGSNDSALPAKTAVVLTELTSRLLGKDPALTAIQVRSISPADWFVDGRTLAVLGLGSFSLDVAVTAGTNTKAEIAAYIEAVFSHMQRHLGPIHAASYVTVLEVPASSWGYGGATQEYRYIDRRIRAAA